MKHSPIALAVLHGWLVFAIAPRPLQAQPQQSPFCDQVFVADQINRYVYPSRPIPENIAINDLQKRIADFGEVVDLIAADKLNSNTISRKLFLWLQGNPTARPPEAPYSALLDELLLEAKTDAERNQILTILDRLTAQLAPKVAANDSEILNHSLMIAQFYNRLKKPDRAAPILEQAVQAGLKQPNIQQRSQDLGRALKMAIELKQVTKVAPYADRIAVAIEPEIKALKPGDLRFTAVAPLALVEVYASTQQASKGLQLLDRLAKLLSKETANPEIPRLYLQLGKFDQAQVYIDRLMKLSFYDNGSRYALLVATYAKANRGNPQALFNHIWSQIQNDIYDNRTPLVIAYLKADGNPELAFQTLKAAEPDERLSTLLPIAGAYKQRGQLKQANQAIDLWIRTFRETPNRSASYFLFQALRQGYQGEVAVAFKTLSQFNLIDPDGFTLEIAQKTNQLELIEPPIQRLLRSEPDRRIELLQALAIAHAQQGRMDKAVAIAERIPRRDPRVSSAVDTLTKIVTVFHRLGQSSQAQTVLSKTEKIVAGIQDLSVRSLGYGAIAREYQRQGRTQEATAARRLAISTAQALPRLREKGIDPEYTLSQLSQQYVDARQVKAAWQALQAIPKPIYIETNLSSVVIAAVEIGDLAVAAEAMALIDRYQAGTYLSIAPRVARAYLAQERSAEAKQIMVKVGELLLGQKEKSPDAIEEAARLLGQVGEKELAQNLWTNFPFPGNPGYESRRQALKAELTCYP